jgi:hypothetical protein
MPNRFLSRVGAISVVSSLLACSSGGPGGDPASVTKAAASVSPAVAEVGCDNRAIESRCIDYWSGATASDVAASCDGTVHQGTCPKEGSVGTCDVPGQNAPWIGKKLLGVYYANGPTPWTKASAEQDCAGLSGVFAGP